MGMAVEVAQRQSAQLRLDVTAHARHDPLGQSGHGVALEVAEGRPEEVDEGRRAEDSPQVVEVDADSGRDLHARDHRGDLALAVFAQQTDRLGLGRALRQPFADDAVEENVGGVAQDLRARHHEPDRRDAEHERQR